jgi:hypothetical protein
VQFEDNAEEAVNRRQTILAQRAVTAAHGPSYRGQRNWKTPLMLGGGLVAVLAALYVVFVR